MNLNICKANRHDAEAIKALHAQMGYEASYEVVGEQLCLLLEHYDAEFLIAELRRRV